MERGQLVGWKEIGNYLGVDPKTAARWEKTLGLPIQRGPNGRPTALPTELDAWKSNKQQTETEQPPAEPVRMGHLRWILVGSFILACVFGLFRLSSKTRVTEPVPTSAPPRLFWRYGGQAPPPDLRLPFAPYGLVLSGSEEKLFVLSFDSSQMAVVDTRTMAVKPITLPLKIQSGRLAFDGRTLLIGSTSDGFLLFDAEAERVINGPVSTGGMISDLVMTKDGKKVFLAMRGRGLKRWSADSGRLDVVTPQQSPWFLGLDEASNRLFVSYQGGGPKGRPGHDSVEIFDAGTERSIGFLPDLPLVGGQIGFSPNRQWMVMDGADACRNAAYDRFGCPNTPANVMHIFRLPDVNLPKSVAVPLDAGGSGPFLGSSNALLLRGPAQRALSIHNRGLSVFDLESSRFRETLSFPEETMGLAVSPKRRKLFVGTFERNLMAFDFEPLSCDATAGAVQLRLTGDGVGEGEIGSGSLRQGGWTFEPGLVGQSFRFRGESAAAYSSFGRTFGPVDSGLSAYVRPAQTGSRQVFLELRYAPHPDQFWALAFTEDSRVELRMGTIGHSAVVVQSSKRAEVGRWMFLTVGRDVNGVALYLDGKLESSVPAEALGEFKNGAPFAMGGVSGAYFDGWIDELSFLSRALTEPEVKHLYESRLQGPCKP